MFQIIYIFLYHSKKTYKLRVSAVYLSIFVKIPFFRAFKYLLSKRCVTRLCYQMPSLKQKSFFCVDMCRTNCAEVSTKTFTETAHLFLILTFMGMMYVYKRRKINNHIYYDDSFRKTIKNFLKRGYLVQVRHKA